jgi:hypothetical protein
MAVRCCPPEAEGCSLRLVFWRDGVAGDLVTHLYFLGSQRRGELPGRMMINAMRRVESSADVLVATEKDESVFPLQPSNFYPVKKPEYPGCLTVIYGA